MSVANYKDSCLTNTKNRLTTACLIVCWHRCGSKQALRLFVLLHSYAKHQLPVLFDAPSSAAGQGQITARYNAQYVELLEIITLGLIALHLAWSCWESTSHRALSSRAV